MDNLWNDVFSRYGISGLIITWILWKDIFHPMWRKRNGGWTSYKEIESMKIHLAKLEEKYNVHKENFVSLREGQTVLQDRFHGYAEVVRTDIKELIGALSSRIDRLFEIIGEKERK